MMTGNGPGNDWVDSVSDSAGSRLVDPVSFPLVSSDSPLTVGLSPLGASGSLSTSETDLSGLDSVAVFEGLPISDAPSNAGVLGAITSR